MLKPRYSIFLLCALPVAAQTAAAPPKPLKLGGVTVQGAIRSRFENWSWFEPASGDPDYSYLGTIGRLSFSKNSEKLDWQVELAVPLLLGLPDNAVAPGAQGQLGLGANYFLANDRERNSIGLFPKQAWLRFKQNRHALRVGRFEYMDGAETAPKNATLAAVKRDRVNMRLLGHFGWAHVGRSFDGAHYTYNHRGGNFTAIGATPTRGVFQTDGWGETHTAFVYAAHTWAWGKGKHAADTRLFFLRYHDWRQVLKTDNRPLTTRRADLDRIRIETFGGHSAHAADTAGATFDFLLWAAVQTGRWGTQSHRAHAIDIEAGVQPKRGGRWKPWFRGGFYDGSGDADPADSRHGTFFQVLPTPRPFARFPFFNMMNNRDRFGMLILRPHAKVTLSTEVHSLALSQRNDLWLQGGGIFQPWTFGYVGRAANGARSLANLYDTGIEFRMRPDVTVSGYVGVAQGLAAIRSIYPGGQRAVLGYLEVLYRF